jgi:hypothetical protein
MNPEAKIMLDHCASLGIKQGRMLDLGAGNDVEGDSSVALPFIERGWDVVLVDAAPACVEILAAKYGRHPKVKVVQALVYPANGFAKFNEIPADVALSTADQRLMDRGIGREVYNVIYQPATSPGALAGSFGPFDVMSIDIEGHSIAAAVTMMDLHCNPLALCVEVFPADVFGRDEGEDLAQFAGMKGYRVIGRTKENMILVPA